jgi:RND family efflux transporter MFP subunit
MWKRSCSISVSSIGLAGLLLLGLAACGSDEAPSPGSTEAPSGRVVEIRAVPVPNAFDATGTIRGEQTAVLTSKITGYVRELRADAGDLVRRGQILAVLEAPELDAQLRAAESGTVEAEVAEREAEAVLAAARAEFSLAKSTYERFVGLRDQRAVTRQEFDQVEARYEAAKAQLELAEARRQRSRSARQRIDAEMESARAFSDYRRIQAPFDGRVLERRIDLGNLASPATPLFVVEKEGPLRAEVSVDESMAGRIRVGDGAFVSVSVAPEPLQGTVTDVVPSVDPATRAFLVKVRVEDGASTDLVPGSFARVRFAVGEAERLLVPQSAIVQRGQLTMLYVVEQEAPRLRLVTLGPAYGDAVEVLSGLDSGDRILVN